ncbi:MAG: molybdopterin molybdenumtransferase MoeA [Rhodospirillaceae bacterium]|nr:molybdopterin molybdenumtransferase MoeA [Rhodospirillaceae bacterium]|tara:strand:- start:2516 stop:3733 length:1218 start_codon:yes stop_codon:yes gene_type:complete
MISVEEARNKIMANMPLMPPEQVPLSEALGRVLAEDVSSRRTQPPNAVSAMDGYAVRAEDVAKIPAKLKVVGHVPAGQEYDSAVGTNEAVRIFTGATIPDGADTIVIQENTELDGDDVNVIDGDAPVGRFIRPAGLDFSEGDTLLQAGQVLTARDVGLAAGMNVPWLSVRRKPRIALLATGDEIVMPGDPLGPNQIVSSNGLALAAFIMARGGIPVDLGIAPDSEETLRVMAEGAKGADMLITCGGASVGDHDLVQQVLGKIGLEIDFWRIAMRPGKPLMFGNIGDTRMMGLPGNPVSSLVCATIFLIPAINAMLGINGDEVHYQTASLTKVLPENDEREDYLRAAITRSQNGELQATPFSKQDSSVFSGLARADALILRKPFAPAAPIGEQIQFMPLGGGALSI